MIRGGRPLFWSTNCWRRISPCSAPPAPGKSCAVTLILSAIIREHAERAHRPSGPAQRIRGSLWRARRGRQCRQSPAAVLAARFRGGRRRAGPRRHRAGAGGSGDHPEGRDHSGPPPLCDRRARRGVDHRRHAGAVQGVRSPPFSRRGDGKAGQSGHLGSLPSPEDASRTRCVTTGGLRSCSPIGWSPGTRWRKSSAVCCAFRSTASLSPYIDLSGIPSEIADVVVSLSCRLTFDFRPVVGPCAHAADSAGMRGGAPICPRCPGHRVRRRRPRDHAARSRGAQIRHLARPRHPAAFRAGAPGAVAMRHRVRIAAGALPRSSLHRDGLARCGARACWRRCRACAPRKRSPSGKAWRCRCTFGLAICRPSGARAATAPNSRKRGSRTPPMLDFLNEGIRRWREQSRAPGKA